MIQEVIARLGGGSFALVGGSAEIDSDLPLPSLPAAFVVLGAERASDNTLINVVQQQITAQLVVVIAVRNVRDASGMESVIELSPLRQELKSKLIGWSPIAGYDPMIFRSGQLLRMDEAGVLWWVDTYETNFIERHI